MNLFKQFDITITRYVMSLPSGMQPYMYVITNLGDPIVTIGIGAVVVLIGLVQSSMKLALAGGMVWVTLAVGALLKLLFGRARPMSEYVASMRVDTFSFPSGHSSGSMIAYGLLAYICIKLLPQPFGIIAAVLLGILIFLIGISRIYLGAHFPTDVLAGWLLGFVFLMVIVFVIRPLS